MKKRTAEQWNEVLISCGVKPIFAAKWSSAFAEVIDATSFSTGPSEIDDFLGQILHESAGLTRMEEHLNYSADRIRELGNKSPEGSRWRSLVARADALSNNPVAFANACYGGRMGNAQPGDGFAYRGSGPIMVTGKYNFAELERVTGIPLVASPDLLRRPGPEALRVCIAWWEGHVPDAVMGNIERVRRAVNGGIIGLADTGRLTQLATEALA